MNCCAYIFIVTSNKVDFPISLQNESNLTSKEILQVPTQRMPGLFAEITTIFARQTDIEIKFLMI